MILWTIKLFTTLRRAIAGRRYPNQLAWAVAFGLLLGVIPHGNLLAIAVLVVVLSLKLNHAAAALTAIGASFLASRLDPISHEVGNYVLTHPRVADAAVNAWALPMVPWTNLNNTVVMGSFVIGTAALLPVFVITYPIFRLFRPQDELGESAQPIAERVSDVRSASSHPITIVHRGHDVTPTPCQQDRPVRLGDRAAEDRIQFHPIEPAATSSEQPFAVQTRIEVIRMKESSSETVIEAASAVENLAAETSDLQNRHPENTQPMDEALNYLLRQLRDSQQRNAA